MNAPTATDIIMKPLYVMNNNLQQLFSILHVENRFRIRKHPHDEEAVEHLQRIQRRLDHLDLLFCLARLLP